MDDADYIRETTLAYGAVMNLMDRIVGVNEEWTELLDTMSDVFDEEHNNKDPEDIFSTVYQFLFRLYLRLKINPEKRPFNIVTHEKTSTGEWFRITNYDYNTFKWAKKGGFISGITNDFIDLPLEKLNDNQIKAFEKRARKE